MAKWNHQSCKIGKISRIGKQFWGTALVICKAIDKGGNGSVTSEATGDDEDQKDIKGE